jgi:aryl-phospho-beta-D-glucosidase BglC (GH1 family)
MTATSKPACLPLTLAALLTLSAAACSSEMAVKATLASEDAADYAPALPRDPAYQTALPLRTDGRFIVDANGRRVKLAAVNWYGASDVHHVVGGLDKAHRRTIVDNIRKLGFNAVRLPFSNAMLRESSVADEHLAANPDLLGRRPLEVFDAVVSALTEKGLLVLLNNHTTTAKWCCGDDENALWFNDDFSTEQWLADWARLTVRYESNPYVVGADLRNEVRASTGGGVPNWGLSDARDWRKASEEAGNRLLAINPSLLIIVEGLDYASHLTGAREHPVRLSVPRRLVYSTHSYSWFRDTRGNEYKDATYDELERELTKQWGFASTAPEGPLAPVWVSEFGTGPFDDEKWFTQFTAYLAKTDLDFAFWPLNVGPQSTGSTETWGLVTEDWQRPIDDWRTRLLRSLL